MSARDQTGPSASNGAAGIAASGNDRLSRTPWVRYTLSLIAVVLIGLVVGASSLSVGERVAPDFALTDQFERPVKLSELRGAPVVLTFVYTHCPDVCPLYLTQIQQLSNDWGAGTAPQVVVVTVDPERDTPVRLRGYASAWPSGWRFLTGSESQLRPVWRDYQIGVQKSVAHHHVGAAPDLAIRHTAKVVIINSEGQLVTELVGEDWSVAELRAALARTAPTLSAAQSVARSASQLIAAAILACGDLFGGDPLLGAAILTAVLIPGVILPVLVLRALWSGRPLRQRSASGASLAGERSDLSSG